MALKKYWIMKSEPDVFSFSDLQKKGQEFWDGVRNYQARNFMMHEMNVGDAVLFYHSNADPSGIAGRCEVIAPAKPDTSAQNPASDFFDPKATPDNPRWFAVTVGKPTPFKKFVCLWEMRENKKLKDMLLLRKGQRLSILPLTQEEFEAILLMSGGGNP